MPRRPRHIPLRSCVACGLKTSKGDLLRIVRTPQDRIELDLTGKKTGRGAYLCKSFSCWDKNLKRSRLEWVLRGSVSQEDLENLISQCNGIVIEATA
ncbi:MAG: YlxR family protein [Chloroflexi bacterium]|nr:YlxR family protein [Chloroflexota bacterium]